MAYPQALASYGRCHIYVDAHSGGNFKNFLKTMKPVAGSEDRLVDCQASRPTFFTSAILMPTTAPSVCQERLLPTTMPKLPSRSP